MAPTTTVRAHAQAKCPKRFRTAYGQHRPRADSPRRPSSTTSPASPSEQPRAAALPLTVTSRAGPTNSHRQTFPSFSTDNPLKPNCRCPGHVYRQHRVPPANPLHRLATTRTSVVPMVVPSADKSLIWKADTFRVALSSRTTLGSLPLRLPTLSLLASHSATPTRVPNAIPAGQSGLAYTIHAVCGCF